MNSSRYIRFNQSSRQTLAPHTFCLGTSAPEEAGVFTTFRTIQLGKSLKTLSNIALPFLDYHLNRLVTSRKRLFLWAHLPDDALRSLIQGALLEELAQFIKEENTLTDIRVRIILKKDHIEFTFDPYVSPWASGIPISARTVRTERLLPEIKSTFIQHSDSARKRANELHAEEAFLVSSEGQLLEGAWTNIFWIDLDGLLSTTKSNILPGITRQVILEQFPCRLVDLCAEEFHQSAVEVFVTQSTTGITPVQSLDLKPFKRHASSDFFNLIYNRYEQCLMESAQRVFE